MQKAGFKCTCAALYLVYCTTFHTVSDYCNCCWSGAFSMKISGHCRICEVFSAQCSACWRFGLSVKQSVCSTVIHCSFLGFTVKYNSFNELISGLINILLNQSEIECCQKIIYFYKNVMSYYFIIFMSIFLQSIKARHALHSVFPHPSSFPASNHSSIPPIFEPLQHHHASQPDSVKPHWPLWIWHSVVTPAQDC